MDRLQEKLLTRTNLETPGAFAAEFFGGTPVSSGVNVNAATTLGLPAIWRAVRLMSSVIASLPLGVFENTTDGKKKRNDHPIYRLLKDPNPFMTGYTWREVSTFHAHFWGNGISLISERTAGIPSELLPIEPKNAVPIIDARGRLWYRITIGSTQELIDPINILHFKGLSQNGIWGKDLVTLLKENLGLAIAQQQNAAEFFGSGSKLKFAVTTPGEMNVKGVENLRKSWKKLYVKGGEDVAFLDAGMDLKQITATPEESQNIQSRKFSVTDISRITGIPPPLLFDLERATFSNISELNQIFVKFDLSPWTVNFEAEYDSKLFKESEKLKIFTKHNLEGLLRGDPKTRSEFYWKMFQMGVFSPNIILELEDMNPYVGGDRRYVMQNMIPVNQLDKSVDDRLLKIEKLLNGNLKKEEV